MAEAEGERQERLVIIVRRDLAAMRQLESTLEDAMQQATVMLTVMYSMFCLRTENKLFYVRARFHDAPI